jgi:hypothetical protein
VFEALEALVRQSGLAALIATHNHELPGRMDRRVTLARRQGRRILEPWPGRSHRLPPKKSRLGERCCAAATNMNALRPSKRSVGAGRSARALVPALAALLTSEDYARRGTVAPDDRAGINSHLEMLTTC